jgi:serine/threonine-protein kinase
VLVPTSALAAADGDPFIGMMVAERFAVLELLGAGSMGTVYRARQEAMRRDVAIKIVRSDRLVDPQAKGRFQQEAQATSLLTSPHTVTVFDFGEINVDGDDPHFIDGSLFLAMELLDGEALGTRIKRLKRMSPREAVTIVRHALLSLGEAHDKGVIHRDLKPDNLIMVRAISGDEEICKVLDFGIAKLITHQGGIDALETQAGTVFGTPRYMSPEQAQGKALDARSDLYSLGVILYHMLLGKPPYTDNDAVVVMAHHIKTIPKRPNLVDPDLGLPQALEDLLMRALDKDPDQRPQSATEFVDLLDGLGPLQSGNASAELTAVVNEPGTRSGPISRRQVRVLGAAMAAIVGLAAAIAVTQAPQPLPLRSTLAGRAAGLGVQILAEVQTALAENKAEAERVSTVEAPATSAAPSAIRPVPKATNKRGYTRFDQ